MACEEPVQELGKNFDAEELLSNFFVEMPEEYTESEKTLKKELASLRRMKRTLTEISQIKKEEKPRAPSKTGEKAKEEAMELLRSGAIQITDKKERHTFKRKTKELEEEEAVRSPIKTPSRDKQLLYGNFLRGPKLMPLERDIRESRSEELGYKPPISFNPDNTTNSPHTEPSGTRRKQVLSALEAEEDEAAGPGLSLDCSLNEPTEGSHRYTDESFQSSDTILHVGYHKITEEFIQEMFQPIGQIVRIKIGEHQNHAYVTMATHEMAEKALELDHQMIDNRLLRVGFARRQFAKPKRGSRPIGPFSPKGRRNFQLTTYNSVPPMEASRDLVTYEDLDFGDQ